MVLRKCRGSGHAQARPNTWLNRAADPLRLAPKTATISQYALLVSAEWAAHSGNRLSLTLPRFESSEAGVQANGRLPEGHSEWRITLRPFAIAADRWLPSL